MKASFLGSILLAFCMSASAQELDSLNDAFMLADAPATTPQSASLPAPFLVPKDPQPGSSSSCMSCTARASRAEGKTDLQEKPYLGNDGSLLLNAHLIASPFFDLDGLFAVKIGRAQAYAPQNSYSIILPDAPNGTKGFLTVCDGARKIFFETKTGKLEDLASVSRNVPSAYLKHEGDKLIVGSYRSQLEQVYECADTASAAWRVSSIRRTDAPGISMAFEYSGDGKLQALVLPGNLRYTLSFGKDGLVEKLIGPDGETSILAWDGKGMLKSLRTLLPSGHPLYPVNPGEYGLKQGESLPIRDIHCEYNASGKLISLIGTNGEKFSAEYKAGGMAVETHPDGTREFLETRINSDGTKSVKSGYLLPDGAQDVVNESILKNLQGGFSVVSEKHDGIETKFEYSDDPTVEQIRVDALGNKTVQHRNKQGLVTSKIHPDGSSLKYSYDSAGRILSETNELGYETTYSYDTAERIVAKDSPDGLSIRYMYDNSGLPMQIIAKDGTISHYEWDNQLRLTSITHPDGTRTEWTYKGALRLPVSKSKVANDGKAKRTLEYAYDPQSRQTKLLYPDGTFEAWKYGCCDVVEYRDRANAITKHVYDASSRRILTISPNDEKTSYAYDYRGRLVKTVFPDNTFEQLAYGQLGKHPLWKDFRDGKRVLSEYDKAGRITKETWQDGSFSEYTYDIMGRQIAISGPHKPNLEYTYDALSRITLLRDFGMPRAKTPRITKYEYAPQGYLTKIVKPDASIVTNIYSQKTGQLMGTAASGIITCYNYGSNGQLASIARLPEAIYNAAKTQEEKDALYKRNIVENRLYDTFGHFSEIRNKAGLLLSKRSYMEDGHIESVLSPVSENGAILETYVYSYGFNGTVVSSSYSKFLEIAPATCATPIEKDTYLLASTGNIAQQGRDLGRLIGRAAEKAGRILWTEDALGEKTEFKYDLQTGRLTSIFQDGEKITSYAYDRFGRCIESIDVLGRIFKTVYDKSGKPEGMGLPDGSKRQIEYDQSGRIMKRDGAGSYPLIFNYESFGSLSSYVDTNGFTTQFEHDLAGHTTKRVWADGSASDYKYDSNGRICLKIEAERSTAYEYDLMGRLVKVRIQQASKDMKMFCSETSLEYDADGRLSKILGDNGPIEFIYDSLGRIISEKGPVGVVKTSYDSRGHVAERFCRIDGQPLAFNTKYFYDELDRIKNVISPAGEYEYKYNSKGRSASIKGPGYVEIRNYDKAGRLVSKALNGKIFCFYEYDSMDRRIKAEVDGVKWEYRYDQSGQLVFAKSSDGKNYDYSYDKMGNRLGFNGEKSAYNSLNQNSTSGYSYDAHGNTTTSSEGWDYTWDGQNRLIKAEKGNRKLEFSYDFMSRRIGRKVYEGGHLTVDEKFLFDGFKMTLKFNALKGASSFQQFSWIGQDLLSGYDASHESISYIKDGNKNVLLLLGKNGAISNQYAYSPFGELTSKESVNDSNPYRFSSEQWDPAINLAYYNFRYYSPSVARWLSRDPIKEKGGSNLYVFISNDAVNKWDINGLEECCGGKVLLPGHKCCGNETKGTSYNPEIECCCKSKEQKVAARADILLEKARMLVTSTSWNTSSPNWSWDNQCSEQAADLINHLDPKSYNYWDFDIVGGYYLFLGVFRVNHHVVGVFSKCDKGCDCNVSPFIIDPFKPVWSADLVAKVFGLDDDDFASIGVTSLEEFRETFDNPLTVSFHEK